MKLTPVEEYKDIEELYSRVEEQYTEYISELKKSINKAEDAEEIKEIANEILFVSEILEAIHTSEFTVIEVKGLLEDIKNKGWLRMESKALKEFIGNTSKTATIALLIKKLAYVKRITTCIEKELN